MSSFYDSLTATYKDPAYALDSASVQQDGTSIFDSAANIVTKGVPLTALAIINSFANTGIKVANFFGADISEISTRQQALDYFGDDTAKYYDENSGAIEFGALAIGSFIPGMAALRVLKLAQNTGETGLLMGRALGFFTANRTKLLANAEKVLAEGENAIFPMLRGDTYKAIAYGFGEQALQGLVWETATVATMQANPILSQMDLQDTVTNILIGGAVGGVIGGGFDALGTLKQFKNIRNSLAVDTNKFEKITRLGGKEGTYGAGDRTALMIDDILSMETPSSTLEKARASTAISNAEMDAKKHLQSLVPGNEPIVANSFFDAVYGAIKGGKATINDGYDFLSRLVKISRPSLDSLENSTGTIPTGEHFYINSFSRRGAAESNFESLISSTPHKDADLTRVYRINQPGDNPVISSFQDRLNLPDGTVVPKYKNATHAFKENPDIDVYIDERFRIRVNPASERVSQVAPHGEGRILSAREELSYRDTGKLPPGSKPLTSAPIIFNKTTGAMTDGTSLVPVVGDIGVPKAIDNGLLVGEKFFPQSLSTPITAETTSIDANARYVWAADRKIRPGDQIQVNDIAMLEQLHREMSAFKPSGTSKTPEADFAAWKEKQGVKLVGANEEVFPVPRSLADLEQQILEQKQILAGEILTKKDPWIGKTKVVDSEGKPATVYHGTRNEFDKFSNTALGSNTGAPSARGAHFFSKDTQTPNSYAKPANLEVERSSTTLYISGADEELRAKLLATDPELASMVDSNGYVWEVDISSTGTRAFDDLMSTGFGPNVRPSNIKLENPLIHDFGGKAWRDVRYATLIAEAKSKGYDGVIFKNTSDGGPITDIYAVFDPKNIRSIFEPVSGETMSATDLSRRLNVPEAYLENGLSTRTFADATIPIEQNATQQHFKLEYDLNNWQRLNDGMVARGAIDVQYRINVIKQAALSALNAFAKNDADAFFITATAQQAGLEGAGAGFFSFANASYNSVKQQFERVGRAVERWTQRQNQMDAEALAPVVQKLRQNPQATAEVNMFTFVRQTTGEHFVFAPAELIAQGVKELTPDTAILAKSINYDRAGRVIGWNKNYVPNGFIHPSAEGSFTPPVGPGSIPDRNALRTTYALSPDAANFERANLEINSGRGLHRNNWWTALGMEPKLNTQILYAPPIDTTKYPFFAMVRQREGAGWADNSTAVVTAKSAQELDQKLALLSDDQFEKFTKDQIKKHHEVQGDYDYNRNFAQNTVNSELRRRGILNDLVPDIGVDSLVRNTIDYHSKQNLRLVRDYTELGNGQLFSELRALGQRYTGVETSKVGFLPTVFGRTAQNPYNDMIKTALAISPKENYRLWADANDRLESMFSTAFATAKNAFTAAKDGHISFDEANIMANRMGIGNVYGAATDAAKSYEALAQMLPPQRYLSKFVATANSVMAATAIRLDAFQALINAVATPVLLLAETHSATRAVQDLLTTELPGTGKKIPSVTKLMYQATASFVKNDADRQALTPVLKQIGALKDNAGEYYRLLDEMTLPYDKLSESGWATKAANIVELGAKYTGNNLAEEFSRYVPGYIADKIFRAAGYEGQALKDNIATFVNRVQGGTTAAQRPVAFQGPVGQAIGLFQSYQINLLQQLFRYAADGEGKSLAILAGAQTTLFGINGLPGFQAMNQHLIGIAPGNPSHNDFYSSLTSPGINSLNPLQKSVGDYILYGSLSNILHTGLYSRGDISPRSITILPINPLDFPAVSGGIKLVSSLIDVGRNITNGGSVPASLLLGLEHNGLSRPLSGLAQLAQGYVTTGKGGIIATTRPNMANNEMGFADLASVANFSRLLGARPLDEAIVLDTLYRSKLYKAKDLTRVEQLGEAFKTLAYGGKEVSNETVNQFAASYAAAGGNVTSFGKSVIAWTNAANVSTANNIYRQLSTPENQNYIRAMGGVKLPDFAAYNAATTPSTP